MSSERSVIDPPNLSSEVRLSRRQLLRRSAAVGLSVPALAALLAACADDDTDDTDDEAPAVDPEPDDTDDEVEVDVDDAEEEPDVEPEDDEDDEDDVAETPDDDRYGGVLEVATIGEPPTLDVHRTTAVTVALRAWHMYEALFTWDADFQITMELAESLDVSEDGQTMTVTTREGVNFHNGDEMVAQDVVDSINRWGTMSGLGQELLEATDEMEIVDDHTIEFQMAQPFGAFTTILSRQNQGCAIYPSSVVEESTEDSLADIVGTGPYRFVEHQPDRHVLVERFDDYSDVGGDPDGYGGHKAAYVDQIYFYPVPDEASRIAGLRAGDYHFLESISPDHHDSLVDDDSVVVEILAPMQWGCLVMNMAEGILVEQQLRQAVQTTLDHEEMSLAGYGEGFFRLDPGLMFQETAWHSLVGEDRYSPNDPERAWEMAEEAGYDGEPIRVMATQEYAEMYDFAAVAQQQLEDAGFTIELEVVDWATLIERRNDPEAWDIFTTFLSFRPDPIMLPPMQGTTWPGWWGTEDKVRLLRQMHEETDFDSRFEYFEELQDVFYNEVPLIKVADAMTLNAQSPRLQGFEGFIQLAAIFYNVWLED
jgi:peptide/nickel transport system substrate-binding protein